MTGNQTDKIDRSLDETLPNDLEEVVSTDKQTTLSTLTFAQSVDDGDYQPVFDREIDRLEAELDVPTHASKMASRIAQQFVSETDLSGRAIELWATACLYCACKVSEVPLSPADFTNAGETVLTRKMLLHRTTEVASTVGLDPSAFFGSTHYAEHYCEKLGLNDEIKKRAREIIERLEEDGLSSGKSPSGWAGAAVYNAAREHGESVTQATVSEVANVTEVTIRNRYQEQREALRDMEPTPETPENQVEHIVAKTQTAAEIGDSAISLLEQARVENIDVDNPLEAWAAAAILVSSEQHGERVGLRTLQQYYDRDEVELHTLTTVLRQARRGRVSRYLQRKYGDSE